MPSSIILLLLVAILNPLAVVAFTPAWGSVGPMRRLAWATPKNQDSYQGEDRDLAEIDKARKSLEALFQGDSVSSQMYGDKKRPDHVLSSVACHRLTVEMALLDSLRESNEGLDELMHLWITERDEVSASQIFDMQEHCSAGLFLEAELLQDMMQQHPTWAEPVIRLATLLFYKGRTQESYRLALKAVQLKPWHIEAPQLLIMICLRNQDLKQALYWARRSLPRMTESILAGDKERFLRRRHAWVEGALEAAQKQLVGAARSRDEVCQLQESQNVWQ